MNKTTEKLGCLFKKHNVRTGDGMMTPNLPHITSTNQHTCTKKGIGSTSSLPCTWEVHNFQPICQSADLLERLSQYMKLFCTRRARDRWMVSLNHPPKKRDPKIKWNELAIVKCVVTIDFHFLTSLPWCPWSFFFSCWWKIINNDDHHNHLQSSPTLLAFADDAVSAFFFCLVCP